jgi:hypothetical protein
MLRGLRWLVFSKHERLVLRRALEGKLPYIGGMEPYGAPYGASVRVLHRLLAETR